MPTAASDAAGLGGRIRLPALDEMPQLELHADIELAKCFAIDADAACIPVRSQNQLFVRLVPGHLRPHWWNTALSLDMTDFAPKKFTELCKPPKIARW